MLTITALTSGPMPSSRSAGDCPETRGPCLRPRHLRDTGYTGAAAGDARTSIVR